LGHLTSTGTSVRSRSASPKATAAASVSEETTVIGTCGRKSADMRMEQPGRSIQARRSEPTRRPRPAVWWSVIQTEPVAAPLRAPSSASMLVEGVAADQ
jgi:hypothetical protein